MAAAAGHGGNGGAPAMAVTPVKSMERRASLRRAGAGAAPPAPPDAEKGKARHATPLLLVILWTSMACAFVAGYSSALTRRWLLSLPGVADALSERRCSERTTCTTPDAARTGPSGVLYRAFFSAPSVALLVGAALGAWTLRTRGRRTALMAANATYIAAFVIATAARDYYTLLVGSLVGELASGIVVVAVVVVDAELAPPKKRLVFMTASSTVAFGMGALCASCLALAQIALPSSADNWFWRVMTAFGAWPCFLLLAIVPFVPESPLLLVQRGRTAEALQTLKDLRGPFADVRDEHTGIIHEIAEAQADDARMRRGQGLGGCVALLPQQLRQLLSWRHRPTFLVSLLGGALDGLGHTAEVLAGDLEVSVRASFDHHYVWLLARFVQSVLIPLGGVLFIISDADRFSRRKMLTAGTAVVVAALIGLAVVEAQPYGGEQEPPYPIPLAALTFTLSAIAALAYNCVVSPVTFLVPAELSTTGVRGAAVAANYMFSRLCRLLWGLVADSPAVAQRRYAASALTGALAMTVSVLCWLFLPDGTQRMPLEECRHAWQKHWYWGRHAERWAIDLPQRGGGRPSVKLGPQLTFKRSLSQALAGWLAKIPEQEQ